MEVAILVTFDTVFQNEKIASNYFGIYALKLIQLFSD